MYRPLYTRLVDITTVVVIQQNNCRF